MGGVYPGAPASRRQGLKLIKRIAGPEIGALQSRVSLLRFLGAALFLFHADIRVSLRKMWERQRNSCSLQ